MCSLHYLEIYSEQTVVIYGKLLFFFRSLCLHPCKIRVLSSVSSCPHNPLFHYVRFPYTAIHKSSLDFLVSLLPHVFTPHFLYPTCSNSLLRICSYHFYVTSPTLLLNLFHMHFPSVVLMPNPIHAHHSHPKPRILPIFYFPHF